MECGKMKISKKKAASILASLGLSVSVLAGCSTQNTTPAPQAKNNTNLSDYRCDRSTEKGGEVQCRNSGGHMMFVPLGYVNSNGGIASGYTPSTNAKSGNTTTSAQKGNSSSSAQKGGSSSSASKGSTGLGGGKGSTSS